MAKSVNLALTDAMLRQQLDLFRLEAGTRKQVLAILERMRKELRAELMDRDLSKYNQQRIKALLKQTDAVIAANYSSVDAVVDKTLEGVSRSTAKGVTAALDKSVPVLDVSVPPAKTMTVLAGDALIMGAPSSDWWAKQAQDTQFKFANALRQGIAAGDTNEQIVSRVVGKQGFMETAKANARSLVHTAIQEVANEARMLVFQENDDVIEGVMQLSTLDGNTTDICIAYANMEWTLDGEPIDDALPFDGGPPRHWNCRSVLVPVLTKALRAKLPEGTRASAEGQVPADTTFDQFLSRRSEAEQDEQLGKGRADLWREGKITLRDLLDQKGNPLTLKQLEDKYDD